MICTCGCRKCEVKRTDNGHYEICHNCQTRIYIPDDERIVFGHQNYSSILSDYGMSIISAKHSKNMVGVGVDND